MRLFACLPAVVCFLAIGLSADSKQFRGPNRDGKFNETGLLRKWPKTGPKLLWSVDGLGHGWSSASIAGDAVYVTGMNDSRQASIFAFTGEGQPKWKSPYGEEAEGSRHPGARTTPTIDGERIYVMSSLGNLLSFNRATGEKLLEIDTLGRFGGKMIRWAIAESILIDGDLMFCTPGGPDASIVAMNKYSGRTVWTTKGLSDPSCYCSLSLFRMGSRSLLVTQVLGALVGVDARNGEVLWKRPVTHANGVKPCMPVFSDGYIYSSVGRGIGGVLLELSPDGSDFAERWTDRTLDGFHHGVVLVDGHVYGTGQNRKQLVCLDFATGEIKWTSREPGLATLAYADGLLYAYSETGIMRLLKPSPAGYEEISSFELTDGTGEHWAHPTIANGRLYLRHGDVLTVYDIQR